MDYRDRDPLTKKIMKSAEIVHNRCILNIGGKNEKIVFFLLIFYSSLCLAEFWEDEKLVKVLAAQTGYTLNEGEHISGLPMAYGFTDYFMVGADFFDYFLSCIILDCEWNVVKETKTFPGVVLGVGYMYALGAQSLADWTAEKYKGDVESIKASLQAYLIWLGISKRLGPKLTGHGSFRVARSEYTWDVKTRPGKTDPTSEERKTIERAAPTTNLILGTEYEFSKNLRGLTNIGFDFVRGIPLLGAGVAWAAGRTLRIELGVYYPLAPHIGIYWRW